MSDLKWLVVAECEAKNNGKYEKFERIIAAFVYPYQAEDFINNCLPKENQSKFSVKHAE